MDMRHFLKVKSKYSMQELAGGPMGPWLPDYVMWRFPWLFHILEKNFAALTV